MANAKFRNIVDSYNSANECESGDDGGSLEGRLDSDSNVVVVRYHAHSLNQFPCVDCHGLISECSTFAEI